MTEQDQQPLLTVLLVSYNTRHLLDPCLQALRSALQTSGPAKIIVVDNASADGSAEHLAGHHPDVLLLRSERNLGFGRANNLALPHLHTPYLLLLNTDAFVPPNAIGSTLEHMAGHPECGILGVKLVSRDGSLQPSCRYFPTPLNSFLERTGLARWMPSVQRVDDMAWDHASPRDCDWVPGCFYLIRREVVQAVGLFDPRYFLYFEEVDHCRAAKQGGWRVSYFPGTEVVHLGGESAKSLGTISAAGRQIETLQIESAMLYFRKNHGLPGLLLHWLLDSLADGILIAKVALKRRGWGLVSYHLRRILGTAKLAMRTRLGTQPIR
jgi:GT2 family glycosyltransferase